MKRKKVTEHSRCRNSKTTYHCEHLTTEGHPDDCFYTCCFCNCEIDFKFTNEHGKFYKEPLG